MKTIHLLYLSALLVAALGVTNCTSGAAFENQWVFIRNGLRSDADVDSVKSVLERAARVGYNGVVLECGFDWITKLPPEYFDRLAAVRDACDELRIDIIPTIMSINGDAIVSRHKNLSAAIPVRRLSAIAEAGVVRIVSEDLLKDKNVDQVLGAKSGWRLDSPGKVSIVDDKTYRSAPRSLRFENFGESTAGMGRMIRSVDVEPHRTYRLGCWFKAENLGPGSDVLLHIRSAAGRVLMTTVVDIQATEDWIHAQTGFNTLGYEKVKIYIGIWQGSTGRLWVDDVELSVAGPLNILRGERTPLQVSGANGQIYVEGRDFARVVDEGMNFRYDRPDPVIRLTPDSRIKEGDEVLLDYYQTFAIHGLPTACPSDRAIDPLWEEVIEGVHSALGATKYLLNISEVRDGGWCELCTSRDLGGAQLLAECFARQREIVRRVVPEAELYIWSDMADPEQNARPDYHLYNGDLTGLWNMIPKDVAVLCWGREPRPGSLELFDGLGHPTMAAAYYDADSVDDVKGWVDALRTTAGARGAMYTTWQNQYDLLESFADVVGNPSAK